MARLLIVIFLSLFSLLQAQTNFKRENEFIEYAQTQAFIEDKNSVILFIQNLVCVLGCDPHVPYKINALVEAFPNVKFHIIHTLEGDTLFAEKSQLAQKRNVEIFCDKNEVYKKYGLDFILHKFFIIQNNKILVWNNFDLSLLNKTKKEIKKYQKKGVI